MSDSRLIELYKQASKHSHYQILAQPLRQLIPANSLETKSRFEQERLDFILDRVTCSDKHVVDIGGNTGFFTLELIRHGARSVTLVEGNREHCLFVHEAATVLGWQDRVSVQNRYVDFNKDISNLEADVYLLLNVLHHVGDDYGDQTRSIDLAKQHILAALSHISRQTRYLVFQLGFNWKGDISLPLFTGGTKKELIEFVTAGTQRDWTITDIGIAEATEDAIRYSEPNPDNLERIDALGEFLNRPLFVLESRRFVEDPDKA